MDADPSNIRPGPLGRLGRIFIGLLLAWFAVVLVLGWVGALQRRVTAGQEVYTNYVQKQNLGLYLVALLAVLWLPVSRSGIRFAIAAIIVAGAVGLDYLLAGAWWGLPLAAVLSLTILAMLVFFALAHVVAGVIANPG